MSLLKYLAPLALLSAPALAQDNPDEEPAEEEAPAPAKDITYALGQGLLYVQVFKDPDTIAAALSHDHVIRADGWTGQVTYNRDTQACRVSVTVPVARLNPDDPGLRQQVGLEGTLDDGQREEVKENMLDDDQLFASKYPNISFSASSCALSGGTLSVTGELTIRGKARTVTIPLANFSATDAALTGSGTFTASATDFGFEPFSAGFGALKNKNTMTFGMSVSGKAM
jgi:polyisoprenoid-binding protein YceI